MQQSVHLTGLQLIKREGTTLKASPYPQFVK